jgi:SAM-dependent methyltransferase
MKINENGFWMNDTTEGHANDDNLRAALLELFEKLKIESVLDLGCGPGFYLAGFKNAGYVCDGFDGNPYTEQLTNGLAKVADLSKVFRLGKEYDCVLSLEVGEHIPKIYEQTFVDNVVSHSKKYVILSWAIPGQTGDGHVNCQTNEYVSEEMRIKGFTRLFAFEKDLRVAAKFFWFKNTLMVFKRD